MIYKLSLKFLMLSCFCMFFKLAVSQQAEARDQNEKAVYGFIKRVLPNHADHDNMISFLAKKE